MGIINNSLAGPFRAAFFAGFSVLCALLLTNCGNIPSTLERIQANNELTVVTRNSPTTYFEDADGPRGLEYDLAKLFADFIGVKLNMVAPENFNEILPMIYRGEVHLAAAGLTVTDERKRKVHFGPSYQDVTQQLIYRFGNDRPSSFKDIGEQEINVLAGSSHAAKLQQLQVQHPHFSWSEATQKSSTDLLVDVWNKEINYTVADSNEIAVNQQYYPELRVAFDISEPEQLAWAFPPSSDDSLYQEATRFFEIIKKNGVLEQIKERYYGHVQDFDYVGTKKFMRHIKKRLPKYQQLFEAASVTTDIDWRLLAAIGYQESHWNARAISPTGVRGIMMLTRITAAQMGFKNRIKPENSIKGGARYFRKMKSRLNQSITEPDRTWLALAAYNIGYGHLKDAQNLTKTQGKNPEKWSDVKEVLPLLRKKEWYKQTKHGFARGNEAALYVENIRNYYDILVWRSGNRKPLKSAGLTSAGTVSASLKHASPVL